MRRNKWKKAGLTVLSAVFMGSFSIAAADTGIPALAATKDVAVTEYDEAALVKFKDITVPMMTPIIFYNFVMAIINSMQTFTQAYIMTEG